MEAVRVIAEALPRPVVTASLLPVLTRLATDPVPNVRFNVAKLLVVMAPLLDANMVGTTVCAYALELGRAE